MDNKTPQTPAVFDPTSLLATHRDFEDMQGFVQAIHKKELVWSWGARQWQRINRCCLRFRVSGHHHKGYVYLAPNSSDLFDFWLTRLNGQIRHHVTDIFIEDLLTQLDELIERVPEYKR